MRRAVIIIIVLLPHAGSAALYDAKAEYRRDALDFEENAQEFYREKIRVFASDAVSAGIATSYKTAEKKRSSTWNVLADGMTIPVSLIAGNFYAQEGSGLLYGKLRPYNPDPFSPEPELSRQRGFAPCDSANPAYAFSGAGLCVYAGARDDPLFILVCSLSRSVRFARRDDDDPRSMSESLSTILGRIDRKYPYDTAVSCRTMTGSVAFLPFDSVRCELSALSVSLNEGDRRAAWKSRGGDENAYGLDGFAAYCAYSDGMLSSFAEGSVCSERLQNGKRNACAFQSECAFKSRVADVSVRGKMMDRGYGSPYYSVCGSRSPSDGIFISLKCSPSRRLSCSAEGSSERKKEGTLSSSSVVREVVSLEAAVLRRCVIEVSHTSLHSPAGDDVRSREKFSCRIGPESAHFKFGAVLQRSQRKKSSDLFLSGSAVFAEAHTIKGGVRFVSSSAVNPVYTESEDSSQPLAVKRPRLMLYNAGYSYDGFISAGAAITASYEGTKPVEQRLSFEARCVW